MKYVEYQFDEVVTLFDKQRIPLSSMERSKRQGPYRYYGAQGIIDYIDDYIFDGEYILLAEDGENLKSNKQDLAQLVDGKFWVNNHAHILRTKEVCRLHYFYYWINSKNMAEYVTGSAQPKLSQGSLKKMIIPLPALEIQDRILSVISPIDEKIKENAKVNDNLQEQAFALYSKMIIDNADDTWTPGVLSDIAEITMGQSPKGDTYNEDGVGTVFFQGRAEFGFRFPTRRLCTTEPKRMAQTNDALMSVRAPVGDMNVAYEDCCIGRGLAAIHSKDNHQSYVLYTMFNLREQLNVFNGEGTVFGSINKDSLNAMPINIPPTNVIDAFEEIVAPMDEAIRNNYEEICHLTNIRDSLLPRLMSGEIDVAELDI